MTKRIENEDWSGVRFRNINFAGAKIVEGYFDGADLSGYIGDLKVNGIEVWPLIDAELTRRHPERAKLHPMDAAACGETFAMVRKQLDATWDRARKLTEEQRNQQVDEEWSVVETVRHLVMVVDGWLGKTIRGQDDPFYPIGLPASFMPRKPPGTSIDPDAKPTFEEALEVLCGRLDDLEAFIAAVTPQELARPVEHDHVTSVHEALWVIFDELWAHNQYVDRDLGVIEAR